MEQKRKMLTVLGIDPGSNSVGWSLIREDANGDPVGLVDCGVRIFERAVERDGTPKNAARRKYRLQRRVTQRRARRRARLTNYLVKLGLLPVDVRDILRREEVLNALGDPYAHRARGLDAALGSHELGRAITHIGIRRGFLSNRKVRWADLCDDPDALELMAEADSLDGGDEGFGDEERMKEEGEFKAAIAELDRAIADGGWRTLGEYLNSLPVGERKRNRRTGREMHRQELLALLEKQAEFHPVLTEAVRDEIEHIIFYQRPIRLRGQTGNCSLEPRSTRASMGRLESQRFRYLCDLSHLRWEVTAVDPHTGEIATREMSLTPSDREILVDALERSRGLTWGAVRKLLGLDRKIKFNLEASKERLQGNEVACQMRAVLGQRWDDLDAVKQLELVNELLSFEKKRPLKNRLVRHWGFDVRAAVELAMTDLPVGVASHSLKAMRKLIPHLANGCRYDEARVAAGYGYEVKKGASLARLPAPPSVRNPVVSRALTEVRRVVNAVIATYGKPDAIRLELPRELRKTAEQLRDSDRRKRQNEKSNEVAVREYVAFREANPNISLRTHPSREDRLRYRLWIEQEKVCLYSGSPISLAQVFSSVVEVDHILPYAMTLDDSYTNKVLVFAVENAYKGKRTPWEAFGGDAEKYEAILHRARSMRALHPAKKAALRVKDRPTLDGFISSQLSDTGYLSRLLRGYFESLGCDVSVSKGQLTAFLRHQWGLDGLLGASGEKNRADHRHHAVDATVVALTSRSLYQRVIALAEAAQRDRPVPEVAVALPGLGESLKVLLSTMIVSHQAQRKLVGGFHEDTAFGVQTMPDGKRRVVYRKPLDERFNAATIANVVDPQMRDVLSKHLEKFGGNAKEAFSKANRPRLNEATGQISAVRVVFADNYNPDSFTEFQRKDGRGTRYHRLGNNHHMEIFRHPSGKIEGRVISAWEAARRVRTGSAPLVQTVWGDREFVMALCISDLVEITVDDKRLVCRVIGVSASGCRVKLREHWVATADDDDGIIRATATTLLTKYDALHLNLNALGKFVPSKYEFLSPALAENRVVTGGCAESMVSD